MKKYIIAAAVVLTISAVTVFNTNKNGKTTQVAKIATPMEMNLLADAD